jgi:DNA polymerase I-like protein with 3'-5' exonuclease and polymerase domains
MNNFQRDYFGAYPCIPRFHRWVAQEIQTKQYLETFFGRGRHFFGRPNDDTTLREAIAYCGQSPTADRLNLAMLNIWKEMGTVVRLTAQVHDAVYFQYRVEDGESDIIKRALELIQIHMVSPSGRSYTIPGEAKVGWNWGNAHNPAKPLGPNNEFNPNGLVKWKGHDNRTRLQGLDRVL